MSAMEQPSFRMAMAEISATSRRIRHLEEENRADRPNVYEGDTIDVKRAVEAEHAKRVADRKAQVAKLHAKRRAASTQVRTLEAAFGAASFRSRSKRSLQAAESIAEHMGADAAEVNPSNTLRMARRLGAEPDPAEVERYVALSQGGGASEEPVEQGPTLAERAAELVALERQALSAPMTRAELLDAMPRWTEPAN